MKNVTQTSIDRTGKRPDKILVIRRNHGIGDDEVVCEAKVHMCGLQYIEECAIATTKGVPWFHRYGELDYEVYRGRKLVLAGTVRR